MGGKLEAVLVSLCLCAGLCVGLCAGLCVWLGAPAQAASSIERQLAKLGPDERAQQACVIKGLTKIAADKKLPGADSIETGAVSNAVVAGTKVTAKGGAIRAKHKWYKLTFDCTVTGDQMKATAFTYTIGAEIPEAQWEKVGLWP